MKANRLLYIVLAVALLFVIVPTIRAAAATNTPAGGKDSSEMTCSSRPSRYSIHNEYVEEMGIWMTYTEDGPTGVDGGLVQLLSDYRTCSK
jgi:hypothetical protein